MISLLNTEGLPYETLALPGGLTPAGTDGGSGLGSATDERVLAYRPDPQADGNLQVDPEISLPSPGMDVEIAHYYNSNTDYNGPLGYGRTANVNLFVQASGTPAAVTFTRGNGSRSAYQETSSGSGQYQSVGGEANRLERDATSNLWKETTPDGRVSAYPVDPSGGVVPVSWVQDAAGNRHTFSYGSGRLRSLQDAVGRLVTFSYDGNGLLSTIDDWAQRRTTFLYDTGMVPSKPALTEVINPAGYRTGYGYEVATNLPDAPFPRLNRITDPNGRQTTYAYDSNNRVQSRTVEGQGTSAYTYSAQGFTKQDATGVATHTALNTGGNVTGVTDAAQVRQTFNRTDGRETQRADANGVSLQTQYSAGVPTASVDALGQITTIQRDPYNNPTATIYPDGSVTTQVWGYPESTFDTTGAKRRLQAQVDALGFRTSYSYNERGQLIREQNALGRITTHQYDGVGNHVYSIDPLGRRTTLGYDVAGNVVAQLDPLGRISTFAYDVLNRLVAETDPLGRTTSYAYDPVGNQTLVVDPLGARSTSAYNVWDQPQTVTDSLGRVTTLNYDGAGRLLSAMDSLGHLTTNVYDVAGRLGSVMDPTGATTSTRYDAVGRPQFVTDALSNVSQTVYDRAGRVSAIVDPLGHHTSTVYDAMHRPVASIDALGRSSTVVYDAAGQLVATIDPAGFVSSTVYDALGRVQATVDGAGTQTTILYDAANRPLATVDALGRRATTLYDDANRVVGVQDPLGRVTTSVYDEADQLIATVDAAGYRTTTTYDAAGRPVETLDAKGRRTTMVYDLAGRLLATVDALGQRTTALYDEADRPIARVNALGYRTTITYDAADRPIEVLDARGYRTTTVYDVLGRVQATVEARGYRTTYVYDAAGRLDQLQSPQLGGDYTKYFYDEAGQRVSWFRALGGQSGNLTTTVYDSRGQAVAQVNPLGQRSTLVYDLLGQPVATIDALGYRSSTSYDVLGRVQAVQDARGFLTSFAYDGADRRVAVVDANGNSTTTVYDERDLVRATIDPLGVATSYSYDEVGNVLTRTDGRGQLARYAPDELDRLQAVDYASGRRVAYGYDALSRVTQRQDAVGTTQLAWGPLYLAGVAYPQGQRLTYAYDEVGNLSQLQGPDGNTGYSYDSGSRLSSITDPSGQVAGFSNDFLDRAYQEWTVGGLATYRTFDAAGREITREQFPTPAVPTDRTGVRLAFYTASYDPRGLLQGVQEVDGHRVVYSYDGSSQLLSEARTGSLSYAVTYTYDGLGNRLSEVENGARTSYTYGSGNRLLRVEAPASGYSPGGVTTFSYDGNGNLAQEATNGVATVYEWDEENRLARVAYPGGAVDQFTYFQDGRRYRSTHTWSDATGAHSSTQLFVWDGQNLLLEQNETLAARLHFLSRPEAAGQVLGEYQVGSGTEPTRLFFYGHDLSGNARQVIGTGGAFVHGYLFNAFGEVLAQSGGANSIGPGGQVTSNGFQNERNPIRFGGSVGYYTDTNDRLYVRARHLKPSTGRWMSQDPIGFAGGDWNLYGYVWNSVPNWTDASGFDSGPATAAEQFDQHEEALAAARAKRPQDRNAIENHMIQKDDALAASGVDKYDVRMRANGGPPTRTWPSRSRSTPDDIPPDTSFRYQFGKNVSDYLTLGSAETLGEVVGRYDGGRASGWEVTGAVIYAGADVTLTAFDAVVVGGTAIQIGAAARRAGGTLKRIGGRNVVVDVAGEGKNSGLAGRIKYGGRAWNLNVKRVTDPSYHRGEVVPGSAGRRIPRLILAKSSSKVGKSLPIRTHSLDVLIVEGFPPPHISEIQRIVKPGGRVVLGGGIENKEAAEALARQLNGKIVSQRTWKSHEFHEPSTGYRAIIVLPR